MNELLFYLEEDRLGRLTATCIEPALEVTADTMEELEQLALRAAAVAGAQGEICFIREQVLEEYEI